MRKSATSDDASFEVLMGTFLLAGKKTLSEEIGKNEHADSIRFSRKRFLNLGMLSNVRQRLGRENWCM